MNGNKSSSSATFIELRNGRGKEDAEGQQCHAFKVSVTNGWTANSSSEHGQRTPEENGDSRELRNCLMSQAPRTKSVGLPILRTKIKPSEALSLEGGQVANGSRFPTSTSTGGFKRKNADVRTESAEHASKLPKPLTHSVIPRTTDETNNQRKQKPHNTTSVASNLATVIVSKGIEMKRVEGKISGNKTTASTSRTGREPALKETDKIKHSNGAYTERVKSTNKTKQKSVVPEPVHSKTTSTNKTKPPSGNGKNVTIAPSLPPSKNEPQPPITNNDSPFKKKRKEALEPVKAIDQSTENGVINNSGSISELSKNSKVESYKTVKEFLAMPSVPLPETKVMPEKSTKTLYKSKFWEYVDPKRKESSSKTSHADKEKGYDALAIKSFMEKQKEIRRLKEIKEYEERKTEIENKKMQLLELNEKCKKLVNKPCSKGKRSHLELPKRPQHQFIKETEFQCLSPSSALDQFRKSRGLHNAQVSAVNDILRPTKDGELSGEANKRATLLLKEFEAIVRRECMNVQNQFSSTRLTPPGQEVEKNLVDKAVETTLSLDMPNRNHDDDSISSASTMKSYQKTVLGFNSAAAKIQAAYKGYQVRKIMREANILPGSKKCNLSLHEDSIFRIRNDEIRQRRRMSFYRTPEKPYDSKTKLKAVPLTAPSRTREPQAQIYIPPPPMSAYNSRVSSRPQVLSPLGVPPTTRLNRSFDEPYPKEAIQKLHSVHASPTPSNRSSKADLLHDINFRELINGGSSGAKDIILKATAETFQMPAPSITDALMEKLRLVAADNKRKETLKPDFSIIKRPSGTTFSEVPYESDFESVSSITRNSERANEEVSHDASITDDYIGPSSDSEIIKRSSTPNLPKQKPRSPSRLNNKAKSRSKSPKLDSSVDSTTTVETDVDLVKTADSSKVKMTNSSNLANNGSTNESSKTRLTSSVSTPTLHNLPIPALQLRYQAEKERLHILDKALQATASHETNQAAGATQKDEIFKMAKAAIDEQITAKLTQFERDRPHLDSIQLAVMQCHEQATRSVCEMTKWMTEMKKSSNEELNHQKALQNPVDIAVVVCAAVEEVKRVTEERKKMRQRQRQMDALARNSIRSHEVGSSVQHHQVIQQKDQQLQYPSCSERESPVSSYRDSFDTGSELETTDHTDDTLDSEIEVPKRIEETLKSTPKTEALDKIITDIVQKATEVEIIHPVSEKSAKIEASVIDAPESYHTQISDKVQPQDSETEIPDEISIVAESIQSVDSFKNVSIDEQIEISKTEIPEELSKSWKSFLDKAISQAELSSKDYVEDNYSLEAESPRTENVDFEHQSSSEIANPRSSYVDSFDTTESEFETKDDKTQESEIEVDIPKDAEIHTVSKTSTDAHEIPEIETILPISEEKVVKIIDIPNDAQETSLLQKCVEIPQITDSEIQEDSSIVVESLNSSSKQIDVSEEESKHEIIKVEDREEPLLSTKVESKSLSLENIIETKYNNETDANRPDEEKAEVVDIKSQSTPPPQNQLVPTSQIASPLDDRESPVDSYRDSFETELETTADKTLDSEVENVEILSRSETTKEEVENKVESQEVICNKENVPEPEVDKVVLPVVATDNKVLIEDSVNDIQEPSRLQKDDESQQDTETEIPDDDISIFEESFDSSGKQVDLIVEQHEDLPKTEVEEELTNVLDEKLSQDEIPCKVETETTEREEPGTSEESKADHTVIEMDDNEALKLQLLEAVNQERKRVEDEIRELTALQSESPIMEYMSGLELRDKPPPPYSPPSSESLSYSSRSFFVSVQDDKLRDNVVTRVDLMWEAWNKDKIFPKMEEIVEMEEEASAIQSDEEDDTNDKEKGQHVAQWANSNFDLLTSEVIDEVIRHTLHIDDSSTAFVDQIRRGPMAVKARNIRVPKTKEQLITAVYNRAVDIIPKILLSDDVKDACWKKGPVKWTCRPRDLVDEILVEEMIEEEYLWTELWPEELLVKEELTEKIIRDSIREVIRNCEIALNG